MKKMYRLMYNVLITTFHFTYTFFIPVLFFFLRKLDKLVIFVCVRDIDSMTA